MSDPAARQAIASLNDILAEVVEYLRSHRASDGLPDDAWCDLVRDELRKASASIGFAMQGEKT